MIATVLAPLGASANDRQIAEQIVRSLKQRKDAGELQGFNIDLQVDKGAVWLKGYVSKPEQEQLALDIARRVEGVEKVFNQIELRTEESSEAEAEDSSSRRNVNQAQRLDAAASESVQPEQAKPQLASTEEDVEGQQDESRRIAETLVAKLREEQKAGNLERFGIDVQADKGTLTLKGQMASEEQRDTVLEIARRIPGVKKVVNGISIAAERPEPKEIVPELAPVEMAKRPLAPATSRRETEAEPIATAQPKEIAKPATTESESRAITDEVLSRLATQKRTGCPARLWHRCPSR